MIFSVTGGIACGKSHVCRILANEGVGIVDADQVSRKLVYPGSLLMEEMVRLMGERIRNLDGTLNRSLVAEIIFNDHQKREEVQRILIPNILVQIGREIEVLLKTHAHVCVDAPLLIENNLHYYLRPIVVVAATPEVQRARLHSRGLSDHNAKQRLKAQLAIEQKVMVADYVIRNDVDRPLDQEVKNILQLMLERERASV